jgi:hypothetical protein
MIWYPDAQHAHRTARRADQAKQTTHDGCLASAVGSEQSKDAAIGNLEVQTIHGHDSFAPRDPITLLKTLEFDDPHMMSPSQPAQPRS